ncbi:MAG: hypothetical protein ACJAUP_002752 [Cellvibrionaceae bacterium]|jgi:hypothetical protein
MKTACLFSTLFFISSGVHAGPTEQAKRIHERLTGVIPSESVLADMVTLLEGEDGEGAAMLAMEHKAFYSATIKNWAAPWTNREQDVFVPLNDYTATIIAYVKAESPTRDFREILYGNQIGYSPAAGVPAYLTVRKAPDDDTEDHYQYLERNDLIDTIVLQPQSNVSSVPPAGIMTTHAAAKAFFIDGTNRAMLRYTMLNHMCRDLEQVHDTSRPADRIRQDVSRSPGGDSSEFLTGCVGCHSGMDPLAQAFAYYDYDNDLEDENDVARTPSYSIVHTQGQVNSKYSVNNTTFAYGFVTTNDRWDNYWRAGPNSVIGWSNPSEREVGGNGAESVGRELANSEAFAVCQVEKVFKNVCLRDPTVNDETQLRSMVSNFKSSSVHDYRIKPVFAEAADYCKDPLPLL